MLIGELARSAGVSAQTIRYYERLGLIAPGGRSRSGYRQYGPDAITDLKLIKAAQGLGFTLLEIKRVVDAGGDQISTGQIRAAAGKKLAQIRRRMSELETIEERIRQLIRVCGCEDAHDCIFMTAR